MAANQGDQYCGKPQAYQKKPHAIFGQSRFGDLDENELFGIYMCHETWRFIDQPLRFYLKGKN